MRTILCWPGGFDAFALLLPPLPRGGPEHAGAAFNDMSLATLTARWPLILIIARLQRI